MADYTTIDNPGLFFNTVLYTGNGSTNAITGVGFQPDWAWLKNRSSSYHHRLFDSVRGTTKNLSSNRNDAESTESGLTSFDSDGFTLGSDGGANNNTDSYASWNWLGANGTASNSDGSISSTVSANQTAGFSVVSYSGNGVAGATVGHGLGVAPNVIIEKTRTSSQNWRIYMSILGNNKRLMLDRDSGSEGAGFMNSTDPTSSVFSLGSDDAYNGSGQTHIAYCFAEKQGYSKFGSYTGNGNADGAFIYTGFLPAFIIIKRTDTTSEWHMIDNKRNTFNTVNKVLSPNTNGAEATTSSNPIDFTSQGFKCRGTGTQVNADGGSFIYMAFAEAPFVTAGTKAAGTAR